jgi:hypothetical protein
MASPFLRYPVHFTLRDGHRRQRSFKLYAALLDAASFPTQQSGLGTLRNDIAAITTGTISLWEWGIERVDRSILAGPDAGSTINTQLLVSCRGNTTGQLFSFRIPTVDLTTMNFASPPNGDTVIISGAGATSQITNLISRLQGYCRCPNLPLEAFTVISMRVVG